MDWVGFELDNQYKKQSELLFSLLHMYLYLKQSELLFFSTTHVFISITSTT